MKSLIFSCLFTILGLASLAQSPQLFRYQGLARDSSGNPLANDTLSLRVTIHQGTSTGLVVYKETHQVIANAFGSFSVNIGGGTVVTGNFSTIPWRSYPFFQEVEMDIHGGSNYTSMGTSRYLSVPYALNVDSANYSFRNLLSDSAIRSYHSRRSDTSIYSDTAFYSIRSRSSDSAKNGIAPFIVQNNTGGNTLASVAIYANGNTAANAAPTIYAKNFGMGTSLYAESGNGKFVLADANGLETNGHSQLGGNVDIVGTLHASGPSLFTNTVDITGNLSSTGLLTSNNMHVTTLNANTLYANLIQDYGPAQINGNFYVNGATQMSDVAVLGNLSVSGNLSKGGGSFKIDHPLDPKNKYLYHSFVESPDMKNIYDGTVITDENGNANISLPDYFEALNRDFRYQLTSIGQPSQVWVTEEVNNNAFSIKTDKPNVKISWQVTGIRKDAYAEKHRIVPEVEKAEKEKGTYLYPDSYPVLKQ